MVNCKREEQKIKGTRQALRMILEWRLDKTQNKIVTFIDIVKEFGIVNFLKF